MLSLLAACGDASPGDASSRTAPGTPRVLRVGYSQEPPYAYADDSGRVSGLAPELLRLAQPALGVDSIRFVLVEFDRLLGELEAGRVDVIGAGLFVTPERERQVAFTQPIATVRGAVLLRREDALLAPPPGADAQSGAAAPAPIDVRALRGPIGVLAGAVEGDMARASGVPDSLLIRYPDVSTAVPALLGGEIQGLLLSEPSLRWLEARSLGRLVARLLDTSDARSRGRPALATRRREGALARRIDSALAHSCGVRTCDSLRAHFGFDTLP
jgi:polar amino acid transport system substrate-binding protein